MKVIPMLDFYFLSIKLNDALNDGFLMPETFNYCRVYYEFCSKNGFDLVIITYINKMMKI